MRASTVLAGLLLVFGLTVASAMAHAVLDGASPTPDSVLARAPTRVVLTFGEPVTATAGDLRVYDTRLDRVDVGGAFHPDGRASQVAVALRPHLPGGTYAVTWRVTSADTHVVSGGFRFSVGAPSRLAGAVPALGANSTARMLLAVSRAAGYAGLAGGLGALVALLLWWPGGLTDPRVRALPAAGAGVLLASSLVSLLAQGSYATGRPLAAALSPPVLAAGLAGRFGVAMLTRLALIATLSGVAASVVGRLRRSITYAGVATPPRWAPAVVGLLGVALLATWPAAGHAGTGRQAPLSFAADLAHVTAMTVWIGGLAVLTVGLLPARTVSRRASVLARMLPAFSRTAFTAVAVLVVTGSYQAWREVGGWAALPATGYGRLLLVKFAGVALLVALGNQGRRWVHRHYRTRGPFTPAGPLVVQAHRNAPPVAPSVADAAPPTAAAVRALRRSVAAEVALAVAVLAVTAVLVAAEPARQAYAAPYSRTVSAGALTVQVTVDPAHTGTVTIHLYTETRDGTPTPITSVSGALTLPARGVGPLPVEFTRLAPNHAQASADFAVPGSWLLDLTIQTSPVDATTFRLPVPVR